MSIFNIKRYGEEEINDDTNNELELLKKLKQRIAAQKNITKTSTEKSQDEENLQQEPKDEGAPEENDPSTEGKKKRKRKRKSSISNESGNFYKRFIFVFTRKGNGFLREIENYNFLYIFISYWIYFSG